MSAPAPVPRPLRLAVVSAGLSSPSSSRLLADRLTAAVTGALDGVGATLVVDVIDLRERAVDIAHNMTTGFPPPALSTALESVTSADGLIAVTPVFNASYSGLFKSFFDVVDRDALVTTPVLLGATGGTARHSLALEHALRPLFAHLRATVTPTAVFAAPEDWGASGGVRGAALDTRVARAAGELAALMRAGHRRPADPYAELVPFEAQLSGLRPQRH
ncbi:oxidoreductase [Streptomyces sp. SDr-06]|uniref:CE1759 family FMN reductase n=1 Tax=Streptomyces sp. SDr-06 TaxID=2267702 RepID=UPI000DEBE582|nr:CE1759 family FMN reductase [Streptomyces sp. SDr-06]RCH64919.1 oxidoreductase [Streptomyces sp. SDr-06]